MAFLINIGNVMKLCPTAMVREILFLAAVPEIFTGIRIGSELCSVKCLLPSAGAVIC
jgi:ABC-type nitrate/sulfonate/bicarbonate transport system permease component